MRINFKVLLPWRTQEGLKKTHRLVNASMCGYSAVAMVTINKENVRRTARSSTETQPALQSVHLQTSAGKKQAYFQACCTDGQ